MKQLAEILKNKGLKVTPQRLAVFNFLYNNTEHPTAENIYKALEQTHPSMSLATVYKTLDALKCHGLLQELNTGELSFRYDVNIVSHPHFICEKCNCVTDLFHVSQPDNLWKEIESLGFTIKKEQHYFHGICKNCKE